MIINKIYIYIFLQIYVFGFPYRLYMKNVINFGESSWQQIDVVPSKKEKCYIYM